MQSWYVREGVSGCDDCDRANAVKPLAGIAVARAPEGHWVLYLWTPWKRFREMAIELFPREGGP